MSLVRTGESGESVFFLFSWRPYVQPLDCSVDATVSVWLLYSSFSSCCRRRKGLKAVAIRATSAFSLFGSATGGIMLSMIGQMIAATRSMVTGPKVAEPQFFGSSLEKHLKTMMLPMSLQEGE